jgi:hypothetical protein
MVVVLSRVENFYLLLPLLICNAEVHELTSVGILAKEQACSSVNNAVYVGGVNFLFGLNVSLSMNNDILPLFTNTRCTFVDSSILVYI